MKLSMQGILQQRPRRHGGHAKAHATLLAHCRQTGLPLQLLGIFKQHSRAIYEHLTLRRQAHSASITIK
ncbi:hypothetical protein EDF56_112116 [Novosphingobium sp. PhB165]|nr:hypothetical protein EDF56_112116 [Novosphingobium sp. PhB165]